MKGRTTRVPEPTRLMSVSAGRVFLWCLLPVALFLGCGPTEPAGPTTAPATEPIESEQEGVESSSSPSLSLPPSGFSPIQIEILPLTELVDATEGRQDTQLNVYVSLLDAYSEKIKAPGTFRFELYEYVQRSSEPKGQRIAIWPDVDLNSPAENQKYWRDFLRAYEFTLSTQASKSKTYILEVTCLCPSGKRLSTEWPLKPEN